MNTVKQEKINRIDLHDALFMGNQDGDHTVPVIDTTDVHQLKNVDQMTAVSLFDIVDELDGVAVQNATVHTLKPDALGDHLESTDDVDDTSVMVVTVQAVVDVHLARRMSEETSRDHDLKLMVNNILETFIDMDRMSTQAAQRSDEAQQQKNALIAEKEAELLKLQAELDALKN